MNVRYRSDSCDACLFVCLLAGVRPVGQYVSVPCHGVRRFPFSIRQMSPTFPPIYACIGAA